MTVKRMDNVGIVVEDIDAAIDVSAESSGAGDHPTDILSSAMELDS